MASRRNWPSVAHATHMPSAQAICSAIRRAGPSRRSGNLRLMRKTAGVSTAYSSQSTPEKSTQRQSGRSLLSRLCM